MRSAAWRGPTVEFTAAIAIFAFWGVIARSFHLAPPLLLAIICAGGCLACGVARPGALRWRAGAVVVGAVLAFDLLLLILAFQRLDFATVAALHNMGPILVVALAPLVTGDVFRLRDLSLVMIGFGAVAVLCGVKLPTASPQALLGLVFAALSSGTMAAGMLAQRRLMKARDDHAALVLQYNLVLLLIYAPLALAWPLLTGQAVVNGSAPGAEILGAVVAGALTQGVAMLLFNSAARRLDSNAMARISLLGPALAAALGALLYSEHLSLVQVLALAVVIITSYWAQHQNTAATAP